MKRILTLSMLVAAATRLGAQDTTRGTPRAAGPLAVAVGVVARSVAEHQPQDTGSTFPADVAQLVCFTQITGAASGAPTSIHHVWFHGDTQVADVELQVGVSPWRTWSRKTIPADWTGPWRVEIRDAGGTVLKRIDFTVGP